MLASSACAVQMFDVAFSRRMCCSRVCSAMRNAWRFFVSTDTPMMRPGACRTIRFARRKERRMRSAIAQRHAEPLRVADDDVRARLAGRRHERQRQQIGADRDQRARRVRALDHGSQVTHLAVVVRRLQVHAEHVGADLGGPRRPPRAR